MGEYIKMVFKGVGSNILELPCHRPFPDVPRSGFHTDHKNLSADYRLLRRGFSKKMGEYKNGATK